MEISFSIADLFEGAFGYKSNAFQFDTVPAQKRTADLGSSYYSTDAKGREYYMPVWLDDLELYNPVVSIQSRLIEVETPMTEIDGSVTEIISLDNYIITIRGIIISQDGNFPEQEIAKLSAKWKAKKPVSIRSAITDIHLIGPDRLGSSQAIILSVDYPEVGNMKNTRAYEMKLRSDHPFSLIQN